MEKAGRRVGKVIQVRGDEAWKEKWGEMYRFELHFRSRINRIETQVE